MARIIEDLSDGLKRDFINKLSTLYELINIDLSNYGFIPDPNNNAETQFSDFSFNQKEAYAGKYYKRTDESLYIWIGYYAEYGFCISFWIDDRSLKNTLWNTLERNCQLLWTEKSVFFH